MTPEERAKIFADWLFDECGIATNGFTDKATEYFRSARLEALEEAAKIADGYDDAEEDGYFTAIKIAAAIRERAKAE